MAKVVIDMEFEMDGFDNMEDDEKFETLSAVLETAAEATDSEIKIGSITVHDTVE